MLAGDFGPESCRSPTERVFRSSQVPQLKLATQPVPLVKVRVYKIDLETYFRKMHFTLPASNAWTFSLIDPESTLDFAVPDYAKYKPLTNSVPVQLPDGLKAGVAAADAPAMRRWRPLPCYLRATWRSW